MNNTAVSTHQNGIFFDSSFFTESNNQIDSHPDETDLKLSYDIFKPAGITQIPAFITEAKTDSIQHAYTSKLLAVLKAIQYLTVINPIKDNSKEMQQHLKYKLTELIKSKNDWNELLEKARQGFWF